MIIFDNKTYQTRSDKPDTDWLGTATYVVEDGTRIADKVVSYFPYYDFVLDDDGNLVDVIATERPLPEPTLEERVVDLETENEMISEVLDSLLMGEFDL